MSKRSEDECGLDRASELLGCSAVREKKHLISTHVIMFFYMYCVRCWNVLIYTAVNRGAATDSGPPGQHIHSGPPAFRGGGGIYIIEIAIAFPSQSFFPLLPNQIMLFQLLKSFSFVCNGKVIIFRFVFL